MLFSLKKRRAKKTISGCIRAVALMHACYFVGDMQYKDALQIHCKRMAVFDALYQGESLLKTSYASLMLRIEELTGLIFSLNQLYYRVKDKALFEIGAHELQSIQRVLISLLKRMSQGKSLALYELEDAIQSFEKLFEQALCVVAPDTTIFLFFIQHLSALKSLMGVISEEWACL